MSTPGQSGRTASGLWAPGGCFEEFGAAFVSATVGWFWRCGCSPWSVRSRSAKALGTDFSTKFQLPNTQSAKALSLLEKDFPAASGSSDQIVLYAPGGTLRGGPLEARATEMLDQVAHLPYVRSVTSPFSAGGAGQVSKDGQVAFATVTFTPRARTCPRRR